MKTAAVVALAAVAPTHVRAEASPINKVLSMISDLQAKIIKEGEVVQSEYAEFAEWCEDRSRDLGFQIKTGTEGVDSLKGVIGEEEANIGSLTTKTEQLVADIAQDDKDLEAATKIREKEQADFGAEEKELMKQVDMLKGATGIIEKEMNGGASLMQLKNVGGVEQALRVMVQASLISTSDASMLTAFVQNSQKGEDDEADDGAPSAAATENQSGGIIEVLEDLTEKAQTQLDELRKKETASMNEYQMLKQSLDNEIKFAKKEKAKAAKGIAVSEEKKSEAEGDLQVTSKELAEDVKAKETLHQDCMSRAGAFETETKSRSEELKALATAKKVIEEAMSSAALDQTSFVQVASQASSGNSQVVRFVRDLAQKEQSTALAQLAARMSRAMGAGGNDPFGKVKAMIGDMISKLEKEAEADATKKAYCDKELAETNAKLEAKTDEIEGQTTKIEAMSAKSDKLKQDVAALEKALSKVAKSQAEMDKLRREEKATFEQESAELKKGLAGIKKALQVLNDYYNQDSAHGSSDGAASGIIGLLETVEADLSKGLADITAEEEAAVAEYERETQENRIEETTKKQDVKYKNKESKELDKSAAELTSDRSGVQEELDAVKEYLSKVEAECIAKPESYEERKKRREAEIAGLKDALEILDSEAALLQRGVVRKTLRGAASVA